MSLKAARLRPDVQDIINDQPIVVHRYVLLAGDGVTTGNSWSWAGSWKGRRDTLGRDVWFAQRNVLGEAAQRTYTLLLPYTADANPITVGQRLELYGLTGASLGVFLVTWVLAYQDSSGAVWKVELNIEEYQG